ncbi:hypothetical protein [Segatella copri]|uniref:hypothetical protein n=1 Tax=Segatella copri TaxID=165179 RepID=UPI00294AFD7B|nr:hypothetical protein [Segatella copri]
MKKLILSICLLFALSSMAQQLIDRKKVVERNNPHVTTMDSLNSLSVGNGGFAMTVDGTGLQSFPKSYSLGVPLGTMSDWGWHSFANPENYQPEESWRYYDFGRGRKEPYATQVKDNKRAKAAGDWYRVNPHRLHLGTLGLSLGADPKQIKQIDQTLNMWEGMIKSSFIYKGKAYQVETTCDPVLDMIATHIQSKGTIAVDVRFAYPTGGHCDDACDWTKDKLHSTTLVAQTSNSAVLKRIIDKTVYFVMLRWQGAAKLKQKGKNFYQLQAKSSDLKLTCEYAEQTSTANKTFAEVADAAKAYWMGYWKKGGMADFSNCKDPRAKEMERRVVLSQYLLAIQDAGDTPPQETGLTYNSWFGKFHLEMILWHQAQFALWGHPEMLERSLSWYVKAEANARKIAERQGFKGVRWMKMTDPWVGEAPSGVGSFLIWQQPHLIYLAELLYRANPTPALLQKYARLVDETAEFMGDFADYDKQNDRYILRGCIAAQETLPAATTINPPFELSQWHCALQIAQTWRERLGKERKAHWDDVIQKISPLASKDSLYLAAETEPDTYKNEKMFSDHPAVMGAIGLFPYNSRQIDFAKMKKTEQWIWKNWKWETSWGWDYPMMAMGAARMREPENAVGALLMKQQKNTYLVSGHNYQDGRLRLYLPGNGGYLMAVAMMCAGWDGSIHPNPGFPQDGNWDVKWEGLKPLF